MDDFYLNVASEFGESTLIKLKVDDRQIIITQPIANQIGLNKMHDTYHSADVVKGHDHPIVHTRRDEDTQHGDRGQVLMHTALSHNEAPVLIHGSFIDMTDIDWTALKKFTKQNYTDKVALESGEFNGYLTFYVYLHETNDLEEVMRVALAREEVLSVQPNSDGFTLFSPEGQRYAVGSFPIKSTSRHIVWIVVNTKKDAKIPEGRPPLQKKIKYIALAPDKEKIGEG
jgi:hypothetical protein